MLREMPGKNYREKSPILRYTGGMTNKPKKRRIEASFRTSKQGVKQSVVIGIVMGAIASVGLVGKTYYDLKNKEPHLPLTETEPDRFTGGGDWLQPSPEQLEVFQNAAHLIREKKQEQANTLVREASNTKFKDSAGFQFLALQYFLNAKSVKEADAVVRRFSGTEPGKNPEFFLMAARAYKAKNHNKQAAKHIAKAKEILKTLPAERQESIRKMYVEL